jgi:ribosomal protein L29
MTTRNEILTELDKIELELKAIYANSEADNYGRVEKTKRQIALVELEDELFQELNKYPI